MVEAVKSDYEGFHTRPMSWATAANKFERLCAPLIDAPLRTALMDAVAHLEDLPITALTTLLGRIAIAPGGT